MIVTSQSLDFSYDENAAFDPNDLNLSAQELRRLIFKLQWIGAEDQAELVRQYSIRKYPNFIAIEPKDTD